MLLLLSDATATCSIVDKYALWIVYIGCSVYLTETQTIEDLRQMSAIIVYIHHNKHLRLKWIIITLYIIIYTQEAKHQHSGTILLCNPSNIENIIINTNKIQFAGQHNTKLQIVRKHPLHDFVPNFLFASYAAFNDNIATIK